ncbi:hypothetical protein [Bacillus mycoides]|uniref:hypothetical protein n=1 Tax=Bacillus mycoides TaxID=1405 RepID=UPI00065B705A|nr:hypothetical protein [Bacillus mycoides]KMQ11473.1 hypothetical protein TU70_31030 [Bacillus mycoides]
MAKLRASIEKVRAEAEKLRSLNRYGEPSFQYEWNIDNFIVRTENLRGGFAEPCDNCSRTFFDFYNIDN